MSAVRDDVDFDLHGVVRVRVAAATPGDEAILTRQLGPLRCAATGEPDITVRFVDEIGDGRPVTYVGWPEAGFTDDECYVLRGRGGVPARALVPIADVGGRCEIVCERRAGQVPHLLAIVNFTALAKGVLPLHASAFVHRGVGVLAAGWAKGGKTETLLAFAAHGAQYVGDEWVYLRSDGSMFGVPEPIRLWDWHLRQLPALWAGLSGTTRARLTGLSAAASAAAAGAARLGPRSAAASVLRRAVPVIRRQSYVQVPPAELFGPDAMVLHGQLDAFLLLASHDQPTVTVEPVDAVEVGRRMLASLDEERAPFMAYYRQYRFAFPDRRSDVVDRAGGIEASLLDALLGGRKAHLVRHPYPVRLDSLVSAVESTLPTSKRTP